MATPNVAILTNNGRTLFNKTLSGQIRIQYTSIVFSSDDLSDYSDDQIRNLDDIDNKEVMTSPVSYYAPFQSDGSTYYQTNIRGIGDNRNVKNGFHLRTYALYANDGTQDVLYGITVDNNPGYIAPFDGKSPQYLTYGWHFELDPSEIGNFKFDPATAVYPTIEEFQDFKTKFSQNVSQTYESKSDAQNKFNNLQQQITSNKNNISDNNNAIKNAFNQNGFKISNVENELFDQYRIVKNVGTDLNNTNYGLTIGWAQDLKHRPSDVDSDWHLYMEHTYRLFNNTFVQFLSVLDINKRYYRYWIPTTNKWNDWQDQDSDLKNQYNEVLNISDDFNHENNGKTAGWAINVQNRPSDVDSNWHLYSLDQYRLLNNTFIQELSILDLAKYYTRYWDPEKKQWQQWKITNK